jgi:hypothetical protein
MDGHWEQESTKITKEKPSYYFKRNCWISSEAGEELAPVFVEHVGDDYLMIAPTIRTATPSTSGPTKPSARSAATKKSPAPRARRFSVTIRPRRLGWGVSDTRVSELQR